MIVLNNKVMDKLKKEIKINRNIFVFLVVLMLIALISGSIFSLIIKSSDKKIVTNYLNDFLNNLSLEKLNYLKILTNSISGNIFLNIFIWLLGFSIIGLPLIVFIFFSKLFSIGFTFTSLIMNYKIKGLLFSCFYLIPYGILIILAFILMLNYAISLSFKLFGSLLKKKVISFKPIISRYLIVLLISSTIIIIASLFETFFIPFIYKIISIIWK